jgi:ATP-dependent DNA helicase RecG
MDEKKISRNDIQAALNTADRDIYDKQITPLRRSGILVEICSNEHASAYANQYGIKKNDVPRFEVRIPTQRNIAQSPASKQIFVKGRTADISDEDLKRAFSDFGEIINIKSPKDARTGQLLDFVYIDFSSDNAVEKASEMASINVKGVKLDIRRSFGSSRGKRGGRNRHNGNRQFPRDRFRA